MPTSSTRLSRWSELELRQAGHAPTGTRPTDDGAEARRPASASTSSVTLPDAGPGQLGADPPGLGPRPRPACRASRAGPAPPRQPGDVAERHQDAGPGAEQVLRVEVRGRHHRAAGGDGEGERPGDDLLARPVRASRRGRCEASRNASSSTDRNRSTNATCSLEAEVADQPLEAQPVALALVLDHLGVGLPGDQVEDVGMSGDDRRRALGSQFEPLRRRDQPEGRQHGPAGQPVQAQLGRGAGQSRRLRPGQRPAFGPGAGHRVARRERRAAPPGPGPAGARPARSTIRRAVSVKTITRAARRHSADRVAACRGAGRTARCAA